LRPTIQPADDGRTSPRFIASISHSATTPAELKVVSVVAFAVCVLAFLALAGLARQPGIPAIDAWTTVSLHALASPELDAVMSFITGAGGTPFLATVAVVASVGLAARHRWAEALAIGFAFVGSLALNETLKGLVGRARPGFEWAVATAGPAFPSGHAMNSLVLYGVLAIVAWRLGGRRPSFAAVALATLVVTAIGASRVYLGAHWLTDVLGGALAGASWLIVVAAVVSVAAGRTFVSRSH